MDITDALKRLLEPSAVTSQSSSYLAGKVRNKAAKIDVDRRAKQQGIYARKPRLTPVLKSEHKREMSITPWDLLHILDRATVLSGQGSSRALAQRWSCLKYITTLQSNYQGRMELSSDGKDPRYHRNQFKPKTWGIAFALAAALRIVQERHPTIDSRWLTPMSPSKLGGR